MNSGFSRLDPRIREYIYEKKWTSLKNIQEDAIPAILDSGDHVLIAADTASGKTEACFYPVLTKLSETGQNSETPAGTEQNSETGKSPVTGQPGGVQVLYIGPLKALINDQFERSLPLLQILDIPLLRWHGDVEMNHKMNFLKNPGGILQITPESLEALLLRQPGKIREVFGNLKFIIIDEVHAFIGTDRGSQLICLLERIRIMTSTHAKKNIPRRIGLSATLGDYAGALAWLKSGTGLNAVLISDVKYGIRRDTRRLSLAVDFFYESGDENSGFYNAIYDQCQGSFRGAPVRKCIVFTNSRLEAEETAAALKKIAADRGGEDHYQVHHGSIAAALRAEAETNLKHENRQTIAATATLELGIDIGKLDRIIQIGAPVSVSAFVQRLGRSGRQSGISQMYFCSREPVQPSDSGVTEKIPWTLIKTIAVIELYLREQWTEDAKLKPLPYSLLCHQTLSALASMGEQTDSGLETKILSLPPFAKIPAKDYRELLLCLKLGDYIQRTEEGKYILGLEGERIANHFSFYSVFPDEDEFRVLFMGRELGKINFIPPEGSGIVLAGKNWKVTDLGLRNREIRVIPGTESGARVWRGGSSSLHAKVVQRMKQVLSEKTDYLYLTEAAASRLNEGRIFAEENIGNSLFLKNESGENVFYFLPWLGSRGMRTLSLLMQNRTNREVLKISQINQENQFVFRICSEYPQDDFSAELKSIIKNLKNPESLPDKNRIPLTDKYDYLLPQHFLIKQYAANMLDAGELNGILSLP